MKQLITYVRCRIKSSGKKERIIFLTLVIFALAFWKIMPSRLFKEPTSYVIEDSEGRLLSAAIAADGQWRFPYNREVPLKFIECITTFEDKRFYYHPGVDVFAIGRALSSNSEKNKTRQGGSTITMQVMRLSQKNRERNIWNKMRETFLAFRMEFSYSKDEIMALYASHAPFGSNVVGLDAAAWRYFGRSPEKLSWSEMATLAVLPNSPSLVHPGRNRNALLEKRNRLLDKLKKAGKINEETCALAKLESLPGKPLALPREAPHLLQRFKKDHAGRSSSTRLKTTVNGNIQKEVSRIIWQHHQRLRGNGINNICALVLDVETGNTVAYAGNILSPDKEFESDVDIISSARSPGSALKPLLYAAMLSDGLILPNTLLPDIPTEISGYAPQNFNKEFDGAVPANMALARSLNIPAVRLLQQYKYQRFYEILQKTGISTLNRPADHYGLSLILGGCEVSMWQLAGVYASLARSLNNQEKHMGQLRSDDFHAPRYDPAKKFLTENKNISLDATSVYFTFQAMQEVMRPGEEGLWQQFTSSQKIAWKTGTSFGFRDGWSIGITAKHVVAVWVGNADGEGRPGLTGIETAAPVMFDIFRQLPAAKWFTRPTHNYTYMPVCRQTGFRSNVDCTDVDTLFMPGSAALSPMCPYHRIIHLDATGNFQVNEQCTAPSEMVHKGWFILTPAMEFYYRQRNHDYKTLPPFLDGCTPTHTAKQMELIYPQHEAKIFVPLEINGEKGKAIFTATHRNSKVKIFWILDDQFINTTSGVHQVALSPSAGKHMLTLTDEQGFSISRRFTILDGQDENP